MFVFDHTGFKVDASTGISPNSRRTPTYRFAEEVFRRAKRCAHARNEFWGCTQWPKCRGIVNLDTLPSRRLQMAPEALCGKTARVTQTEIIYCIGEFIAFA
jgi:hypothetical protein